MHGLFGLATANAIRQSHNMVFTLRPSAHLRSLFLPRSFGKLETIGLHELQIRHRNKSRAGYYLAVAGSLAALFLIAVSLMPWQKTTVQNAVVTTRVSDPPLPPSAESFDVPYHSVDPYQLSARTVEWRFGSVAESLTDCFNWIQNSWLQQHETGKARDGDDSGEFLNSAGEVFYSDASFLAIRAGR